MDIKMESERFLFPAAFGGGSDGTSLVGDATIRDEFTGTS